MKVAISDRCSYNNEVSYFVAANVIYMYTALEDFQVFNSTTNLTTIEMANVTYTNTVVLSQLVQNADCVGRNCSITLSDTLTPNVSSYEVMVEARNMFGSSIPSSLTAENSEYQFTQIAGDV